MTERLSRGTTHAAVVSLPEGWALQSDGIVLITITAVTFEDGSRWHAPEDSVERAKVEALHLTSTP